MMVDVLGHVYGIDNYDARTTSKIRNACREAIENNKSTWTKNISSAKKVRSLEGKNPEIIDIIWSGKAINENIIIDENTTIIPFECEAE